MGDRFGNDTPSASGFGTKGAVIVPNDSTDLDPVAKAVEVISIAGGAILEILPVGNADGAWIQISGVSVGYRPPWRVRRVRTTTTATVASVDG